MNMPQALSSVYRNYATGSGRAGRSEYWWYYLATVTFYTVLWCVALLAATATDSGNEDNPITLGAAVIVVIWLLANAIPAITVTVRRLHDVNMSGWLYFLEFVPLGSLAIFIITLLPGTQGSNRYGVDPRDVDRVWGRPRANSSGFADPRLEGEVPWHPRITPMVSSAPLTFATAPPAFPAAPPYAQPAPYPAQTPPVPPAPPYVQQPPPPLYTQQPPPPPYVQQPPPPYVQQPPPPPYVQQPPPPYVQQPPPPYVQQPPPPYVQQPPPPLY